MEREQDSLEAAQAYTDDKGSELTSHEGDVKGADIVEQKPTIQSPQYVPPNGGRKAWATVAGCFLLQFCSFGYVNA